MERNLNGTILIVDISSYIRFIKDTESEMEACIIAKLLKAIIKANHLSFLISDIEDDSILFFRHGITFPIDSILWQFEAMLNSFNQEVGLLKDYFSKTGQPFIKLIVHYGHIGNVSAKSLSILYGPTIADVHNLLKNNITPHTYTLITDEYLAQTEETITGVDRLCELYNTSRLQRTNAFPKTA